MYLKEITIKGFKSFADRTRIEINSELTAIVGPNGSGKSNISDAFKWVLGEQSAKTLRGSKMEDVIFAGTQSKSPLGFAEVNLLFDNKNRQINIDCEEICITRKLFRTGESEYLINNNRSRLKDVRELFMDTGIGIDGYSIIGQGRVEDIVGLKSETRRKVIEEAAGIVKYKSKKEEAERKLEKTDSNLTRINDIVIELEDRIEPLEKQKKAAETYIRLKEQLKELEVNFIVREYDKYKEQETIISRQKKSVEDKIVNIDYRNNSYEEEAGEIIKNIREWETFLENKEKEIRENERINDETLNSIKLNKEKINLRVEENKNKKELIEEAAEKIENITIEQEKISSKINDIDSLIYKNKLFLDEKSAEIQLVSNKNIEYINTVEEKKSAVYELYNKMTELNSRIIMLNSLISSNASKIEKTSEEIKKIELNIKHNYESEKDKEETKRLLENKMNDTDRKISELQSSINKLENESKKKSMDIISNENRLNRYLSEKTILEKMQDNYEGYYKSVQLLMNESKNNTVISEKIENIVAEIVETDQKYETALNIALGSSAQYVILKNEKYAKDVIDVLKKKNMGRVTFLPLDTIKSKKISEPQKNALKMNGCIGVASELVKYREKYRDIVENLLGRVIVADNIENGIKIAKKINYGLKIVTLDGELINAGGAITGGSTKDSAYNLFSRRRIIEELDETISRTGMEIEEAKKASSKLFAEIGKLEKEKDEYISNVQKMAQEKNNSEQKVYLIREENKYLVSNLEKYKDEKSLLEKERNEDIKEKSDLVLSSDDIKNKIEMLEKEIMQENVNLEKMNREISGYNDEITNIRVKITELNGEKNNYESEIKALERQKSELSERKNRYVEQIKEDEIYIEILKKSNETLSEKVDISSAKISEKKEELFNKNEEIHIQREHQYSLQDKISSNNKLCNELRNEKYVLDIQIEKIVNKIENLSNELWENYEMNYAMAAKYKNEDISLGKISTEVRSIKKSIKNLGIVNINSIQEYVEVKERFDFLSRQKADLEEGKEKLGKIISDINIKMKKQFKSEFDGIKTEFSNVFRRLFNGGKADIILIDEDDPLNSEIEILAQPAGKKLESITLLSGGEKALTAIALLFAILRTKPTPFCILDEIEAALDDTNVIRFAQYLKDFSKKTQFLVITHRKGTMEYVDTLYGTTMQEDGVTKLVSVKMSDFEGIDG